MKYYHSLFMDIAERTAMESNCVKYKVGAVIVKDKRIILQGYNGTISGFINCSDKFNGLDLSKEENRKMHHDWSSAFEIHAEMNLISYAARKGISLEGTTLYCTHSPCNNCLKHLIQSGVKRIIYKNEYIDNTRLEDRKQLLKFIEIQQFNVNDSTNSCYVIKFNKIDTNGNIINKDAINIKELERMKIAGSIEDYEIDDNGVKIIKKFDLRSVSI